MLDNIVQTESAIIKEADKMAKDSGAYFYNAYFMPQLAETIQYNGTYCPLSEHYSQALEYALTIYNQESIRR